MGRISFPAYSKPVRRRFVKDSSAFSGLETVRTSLESTPPERKRNSSSGGFSFSRATGQKSAGSLKVSLGRMPEE